MNQIDNSSSHINKVMFILSTSIIKPYTGAHMAMNRTSLWMTGLLALTLSACSSDSTRSSSSDTAGGSGDAAASTDAIDDGGSASASTNVQATPQISYGTVQAIDLMARQDVGVGAVGAAAVGGSIGSASDKVYRVSVKMDDGSSQVVLIDAMPGYKTGDRVRYSKGILQQF